MFTQVPASVYIKLLKKKVVLIELSSYQNASHISLGIRRKLTAKYSKTYVFALSQDYLHFSIIARICLLEGKKIHRSDAAVELSQTPVAPVAGLFAALLCFSV